VFMTFVGAREDVRQAVALMESKLGIDIPHTHKGWLQFIRDGGRPDDVPSNPDKEYRNDGWSGWSDWMGPVETERTPNNPPLRAILLD